MKSNKIKSLLKGKVITYLFSLWLRGIILKTELSNQIFRLKILITKQKMEAQAYMASAINEGGFWGLINTLHLDLVGRPIDWKDYINTSIWDSITFSYLGILRSHISKTTWNKNAEGGYTVYLQERYCMTIYTFSESKRLHSKIKPAIYQIKSLTPEDDKIYYLNGERKDYKEWKKKSSDMWNILFK